MPNEKAHREPGLSAIRWSRWLGPEVGNASLMSHLCPAIAERTERDRGESPNHREA